MKKLWIHIRGEFTSVNKSSLSAVAVIALCYALLERMGITCPILFLSGISCAGCGMSRAWLSLLKGDLTTAASYHPLFWIPPLAVFIWFFRKSLPRRVVMLLIWACCALFFAVYAARLADPGDMVVVFHPERGLLWRLLSAIIEH